MSALLSMLLDLKAHICALYELTFLFYSCNIGVAYHAKYVIRGIFWLFQSNFRVSGYSKRKKNRVERRPVFLCIQCVCSALCPKTGHCGEKKEPCHPRRILPGLSRCLLSLCRFV